MANSNYNSLTLIKSLGFIYVFMSSWKNKAVHIMWDKVSTTTMLINYDDRIIESIFVLQAFVENADLHCMMRWKVWVQLKIW